jgi:hypothetical protein
MQGALLGIFRVAIILIAGPGYAQNFNLPWCATIYTQGTTQCTYYTQQECLETLSGVGGECTANPSADTSTMGPSAPPPDSILGPPAGLDPGPPPGLGGSPSPGPPPY